jgi:hypothetical protein
VPVWNDFDGWFCISVQDGFASILFEVVKGVGHRLHSIADSVLVALLERLQPSHAAHAAADNMQCRRTITAMVLHKACAHVRTESSGHVWDMLHEQARRPPAFYSAALARSRIELRARCGCEFRRRTSGQVRGGAEEWHAGHAGQDAELRLEMLLDSMREWSVLRRRPLMPRCVPRQRLTADGVPQDCTPAGEQQVRPRRRGETRSHGGAAEARR